ncbi:MAG: GAP family protein [Bacteroidales bacterium]|jgi:cytochrome c biogenesis protein CcdA
MSTALFTLSLSLFDSLSTTQQIIIFILLLTTFKPLQNSISYLIGLSGAYIICGIAGYLLIDQLHVFLGKYFPSTANMSNTHYYEFEFATGLIMTVFGIWYYNKKRHAPPSRSQNMLVARLKSMNTFAAFLIGVIISVSSFPVSIPYIIALGKYASLHLSPTAAIGNILLYNFGYALPMIIVFIIYLFARKRTVDLTDTIHEKTRVLNVQLTTWALVGVGIFSMIDAAFYFTIGQALIKGRYF